MRLSDASLIHDIVPNTAVLNKTFKTVDIDWQMAMMKIKLDNELAGNNIGTLNESPVFKSATPKPRLVHDATYVKISAYDDDTSSFYVRFKSKAEECRKFELKVNSLAHNLVPLRIVPSATAINVLCLAQFNHCIHRAKIVQVEGKFAKSLAIVQFLETGLKIKIDVNNLFKIPDDIAAVPPFAKQFKLIDFQPTFTHGDNKVGFYFEHITKSKVLSLKVANDSGEFNFNLIFSTCF